jgi:hypothetical protein
MTPADYWPWATGPAWWHGCGLLLVVAMLLGQRMARSGGIVAIALVRLPGVILHELAHLLAGTLLRAGPAGFSLVPRHRGNGRWTLGSVSFRRVTAVNAVPVALAPLGLLPLALLLGRHWFAWFPPTLTTTLLLYATACLLAGNALPSRQDLRVAANWRSLLLYGSLGGAVWYLLYS